ncbi:MAG TPA: YbhN family protein, partial [Acidimicrobiales bacterium]|nr:YbhN family protein [Acidimicrobiales bacterium]
HVPWRGILVVYGLTQLAAVLPLTPGGLAVVEGSLTALLIAYGLSSGDAVAATLLYRAVGFWAPVPVGWALYVVLTRRLARSERELELATAGPTHEAVAEERGAPGGTRQAG